MKEDQDKPLEAVGNEALEARVVAWILGEASPFEAEELEARCGREPELRLFVERMREVHGMVVANQEVKADADWRLPEAKRRKVTDLLGVEKAARPQPNRVTRYFSRRVLMAAAACLVASVIALPLYWSGLGSLVRKAKFESKDVLVSYSAPMDEAEIAVTREFHYPTEYEPPAAPSASRPAPAAGPVSGRREEISKKEKNVRSERGLALADPFAAGAVVENRSTASPVAKPVPAESESATVSHSSGLTDGGSLEVAGRLADQSVFLGGGTSGSGRASADFIAPVDGLEVGEVPSIMAGNRSGDGAMTRDSIDAILNRPDRQVAEAGETDVMSLTGTLSPSQLDDALAKLDRPTAPARVESSDGEQGARPTAPTAPSSSLAAVVPEDASQEVAFGLSIWGEQTEAVKPLGDGSAKGRDRFKWDVSQGESLVDQSLEPPHGYSGHQFQAAGDEALGEAGVPALNEVPALGILFSNGSGSGSADLGMDGGLAKEEMDFDGFVDLSESGFGNASAGVVVDERRGGWGRDLNKEIAQKVDPAAAPRLGNKTRNLELALGDVGDGQGEVKLEAEALGWATTAEGMEVDEALNVNGVDSKAWFGSFGGGQDAGGAGERIEGPGLDHWGFRSRGRDAEESNLAEAEVLRRQATVLESDQLRDEARASYANGDYEGARLKYEDSLDVLPDAPLVDDRRRFLEKSLSDAEVAVAGNHRRVGKDDESRELLERASERAPDNEYAKNGLAELDEPVRTNAAVSGVHDEHVDAVRRGLYEAEGNFELGKFDEAKEKYAEVLRTDQYNSAARRGMEKVAAAESSYYTAAYDDTRAELLAQVDKAWELATPDGVVGSDRASLQKARARLVEKKEAVVSDLALLEAKQSNLGERDFRSLSQEESARPESLPRTRGRVMEAEGRQVAALSQGMAGAGFEAARQEFETQQRLLEQLKGKLVSEEMQKRVSEDPITVHAEPVGGNVKGPGLFSFDRRWEAKSVVQVKPGDPAIEVLPGVKSQETLQESQAYFLTEFEGVKAQKTLDRAIDDLDLTKRWGVSREDARQALDEMIEVRNIEGTDLIEIRAKGADAEEASMVAKKVSDAYRERRTALENGRRDQALDELRTAVQAQEETVAENRKALATIIRNENLVYRGGGSERVAGQDYAELAAEKIKLESQIETLLRYDGEQLASYAAGLQLPENIIRTLHPQYLDAKRQLEALKLDGLAKDHPNVRQQEAIVEGMKRDLEEGTAALRATLKAQLAMSKEQLARWEKGNGGQGAVPPIQPAPVPAMPAAVDVAAALDSMVEVSTEAEPFSTFSLHVSDASFKLAQAALERGEMPAAESVRPEEFYNAFDYGDPTPASGEAVACVVEQCAHPAFPQRNLMRIAVRTGSDGRAQSTPLNLTLLLDNSGSMEREDRAEGLGNAVRQLSGLLKQGDKVTVAGFSRKSRLMMEQLDGAEAAKLNGLVMETPAEGGTNLEEALQLGEELARRQYDEGAQNRVVLFTDGAANLGDADPERLNEKVESLRQNGIAFDAAGFGADGLNDRMLERLTRNGNGRYYVVDGAEDADANFAKQLAGAFRPAAENVKVQVQFNQDRVKSYKLIGFDEHRLKKEDFRNDAVDAAEMAAEEAGVALYQFEILPEGRGEVGEVNVRFRDTASGEMVERNWTIPYDAQAPSFDRAKPSMKLAGLAAFAAEKLRGAPMAEAIRFGDFSQTLGEVKAEYAGSERVEELDAMIKQLR